MHLIHTDNPGSARTFSERDDKDHNSWTHSKQHGRGSMAWRAYIN